MTKITIERETLQQALDALELRYTTPPDGGYALMNALRAALAAQPAEPVAWVDAVALTRLAEVGFCHAELSTQQKRGQAPVYAAQPAPADLIPPDKLFVCGQMGAHVTRVRVEQPAHTYTYTSTQATECACCGERKHTPLRIDAMGGYVCLTCIDSKLGSLLGEFGYPAQPAPAAVPLNDILESIDIKAQAGLCQFTAGGKHAFLKDIRAMIAAELSAGGAA